MNGHLGRKFVSLSSPFSAWSESEGMMVREKVRQSFTQVLCLQRSEDMSGRLGAKKSKVAAVKRRLPATGRLYRKSGELF
jgi:hypothetical protein